MFIIVVQSGPIMPLVNRNNINTLVHVFCWMIFAVGVLYYHPSTWDMPIPTGFWIKQSILLLVLLCVFYLNFNVLIPRYLLRKKIIRYAIFTLALIAVVTLLNNFINAAFDLNAFFFNKKLHPGGRRAGGMHIDTFVPGMTLLLIGLGIIVSFIQTFQREVTLRQRLEQEKVTTELTLLKAQINPHFFFNTLNTIYSYTLSDGDVARKAITNLSKMMRYVLYDAEGRQTPLSKEIAFIKEYVELMKLRISAKTIISFEVQERASEVLIGPMLFLPFVENAFKHGVSGITEGYIAIHILQAEDSVELIVKNTVYEAPRVIADKSNGIGITNTTRRLNLLYPEKYTLTTGITNINEYEAKLKIML